MKFGSITTGIIADGLTFNLDAANRASYPKKGTTVFDTTNLNLTGSFINDVEYNSTPPNNFQFGLDGIDDYIQFNGRLTTYNQTDITLSFWVRFLGAPDSYHSLCNEIAYRNPRRSRILINTNLNQIIYTVNGNQKVRSISGLSLNTWHNIVLVKNNLDGAKCFIDKVDQFGWDGESTGFIQGTTGPLLPGTVFGLGAELFYHLNGNIANIQVYNRVLSSNEVLHNYNALKGRFGLT